MVLEINSNQPIFGVQSNYSVNPIQSKRVGGGNSLYLSQKPDSITLSSNVQRFANKEAIIGMINANPKVVEILKSHGVPLQINMKVLNDLMCNHLQDTKATARGIAMNLPPQMQNFNMQSLQKAAALHDLGKVLIPNSIVSKKGKLTEKEVEIMRLHSVLGYELLKTTDLDNQTLELIKYHHQNAQRTGYPLDKKYFISGIDSQILYAADIYSALKEERPYKKAMTTNQALGILHNEMKKQNIHPYVFKAVVDYANSDNRLVKLDPQRQIDGRKPANSLSA